MKPFMTTINYIIIAESFAILNDGDFSASVDQSSTDMRSTLAKYDHGPTCQSEWNYHYYCFIMYNALVYCPSSIGKSIRSSLEDSATHAATDLKHCLV